MIYFVFLLLPFLSYYLGNFGFLIFFLFCFFLKFTKQEIVLCFFLVFRCYFVFMIPDSPEDINGNFQVCSEVFELRDYNTAFVCTNKNRFLIYYDKHLNLNYLDFLKIKDFKILLKPDRDKYYKVNNLDGEIKFAELQVVASNSSFLGLIYKVKKQFKLYLLSNLNEPFSTLCAGILIGDRTGFSSYMLEDLRFVGLTHLIAVSGMNVIMLLSIIEVFLFLLPRNIKYLLLILFIIFFAYFTSLTTSVLRACLMAMIGLLFKYNYRRDLCSFKSLYFSAVLLILYNPYLILFDLSFWLSYLATFSILSIKKTEEITLNLIQELKSNFASYWFTLPVVLFFFNTLPIFTVLPNLLVYYPSALILYLTLIVFFLFIFDLNFNFIFYLLDLICNYFFWIVKISKEIPFMSFVINTLWVKTLLFVIVLIFFRKIVWFRLFKF